MLRTLLAGVTLAVMTILLAPIAVAAHVLRIDEKNSSVQQWCMRTWARSLCWASGVALVLAIAAGAPVVPVVVYGTREIMPKGAWRVRAGAVHVHVLAPVETTTCDYEHRHELMSAVWKPMADTMRDVYGVGTKEQAIESASLELSA